MIPDSDKFDLWIEDIAFMNGFLEANRITPENMPSLITYLKESRDQLRK